MSKNLVKRDTPFRPSSWTFSSVPFGQVLSYSVLNASTGSFLLAIFAGIKPAITVSSMLITTSIIPPAIGKLANPEMSVTAFMIIFIGIFKISVTIIPNRPAPKPTMNVSALNTLDMSFLDAPILLKIPISFVLSRTEIYVIIPIIIVALNLS